MENIKYTDKDELIHAVLTYGLEQLEFASEELLRDRMIIFELVREYEGDYRDILEYASKEIQYDEDFCSELANLKKHYKIDVPNYDMEDENKYRRIVDTLRGAPTPLDEETIKKIEDEKARKARKEKEEEEEEEEEEKRRIEAEITKILENKDCSAVKRGVLRIIGRNGMLLESAGPEYQDDIDAVLIAITQNPDSLKFASERLQNHPLVISLIEKQKLVRKHTSQEIGQAINPTQTEIRQIQSEMLQEENPRSSNEQDEIQ